MRKLLVASALVGALSLGGLGVGAAANAAPPAPQAPPTTSTLIVWDYFGSLISCNIYGNLNFGLSADWACVNYGGGIYALIIDIP